MQSFERATGNKKEAILSVGLCKLCFHKGENSVAAWKKAFLAVPGVLAKFVINV